MSFQSHEMWVHHIFYSSLVIIAAIVLAVVAAAIASSLILLLRTVKYCVIDWSSSLAYYAIDWKSSIRFVDKGNHIEASGFGLIRDKGGYIVTGNRKHHFSKDIYVTPGSRISFVNMYHETDRVDPSRHVLVYKYNSWFIASHHGNVL